jgi:hypothetical protein
MPTLPRAGELADSLQIPADETVKRARQVDRTGQRLASRALAGVFQRVMCCTATQELLGHGGVRAKRTCEPCVAAHCWLPLPKGRSGLANDLICHFSGNSSETDVHIVINP